MSVKLLSALLAVTLIFTCFTTACRPVTSTPAVIKEGDDLSGLVLSTPNITPGETADNTALYTSLGAPEHLNLQTQTLDGKLNISADVDIKLPNVSRLPVASAVLRPLSQEEIENIVSVVLGSGCKLTKKDLTIETLEYFEKYQGISVNTEVNGQNYTIRAGSPITPDAVYNISISTGDGTHFDGVYLDTPYGVSLSKEEAAQQAKAIAAQLTNELSLCYIAPTAAFKEETNRNWGWACVFMREINGCPTAYATEDIGSSMESEVQKPIFYEKMVIVMDDQGVTRFKWENPMMITSIDNDNVSLMSFDEIQQRAIAGLGEHLRYDAGKDPGCTVYITRIELGLMRVMKANSNEYYYLPVWNFFSKLDHTQDYKDKHALLPGKPRSVGENGSLLLLVTGYPEAWGSVTINALDGSIVNKNLGY